MRFSEVIKLLIKLSGTKMKDVADYLNYDISYISKWSNDKLLPNEKVAAEVIFKLSKFFSRKMYLSGSEDELLKTLGKESLAIDTKYRMEQLIYSLIDDSYYRSKFKRENNSMDNTYELINMNEGNIVDAMVSYIKRAIVFAEEDIEIYCKFGNIKFIRELLSKFNSFFLLKDIRVIIKCIVDEESLVLTKIDRNIIRDVYTLAASLAFFDLEIYSDRVSKYLGFIYIKDKFLLNYWLNVNNKPIYLLYNEDESVKEFTNIYEKMIDQADIVTRSRDKYYFEERMLDVFLFTGIKEFITYLSYIEGLFITEDFVEKLIQKHKITGIDAYILRKTQRAYSNILSNYEVYINLSKSGLAKSVRKKEMAIANITFTLTDEEFSEYMLLVKETLSQKSNIKIYFMEERQHPIHLFELGVSVFMSDSFVYVKKDPLYVEQNLNSYFELLDKDKSKKIFEMAMDYQKNSNLEKLSVDEVMNLLNYMK